VYLQIGGKDTNWATGKVKSATDLSADALQAQQSSKRKRDLRYIIFATAFSFLGL
jgi:hypothetical protein